MSEQGPKEEMTGEPEVVPYSEVVAYQEALESALAYQQELEQKIEELRAVVKDTVLRLSTERRMGFELRQAVHRLEQVVREKDELLWALRQEQDETARVEARRADLMREAAEHKIETQEHRIQELQRYLSVQSKHLRSVRENPTSNQPEV